MNRQIEHKTNEHGRVLKLVEAGLIDEAIDGLGGPEAALAYVIAWRSAPETVPILCGAVRYERTQEDFFQDLLDGALVPHTPQFERSARYMGSHTDTAAAIEVHLMVLLGTSAEKMFHLAHGGTVQ